MLLRVPSHASRKPLPGSRIDLSHPLGRKCQAACLFNEGQGTPKVAGPVGVSTYIDAPQVQYAQTQANRTSLVFGSTIPTWTTNAAGKCLYFGGTFSGMDIGIVPNFESYDLDYPEYGTGASVTRGQTVCIIRRKVDLTTRASSLFGVEDLVYGDSLSCCGTHCPWNDGNLYWDYGNNSGANRLIINGLAGSWTTGIEMFVFHAGKRGSAAWRNGKNLGSQSTALTRKVTLRDAPSGHYGGWVLNGGNRNHVNGSGDLQEINFVMYIADQWSDDQIRWWFGEPYAAFVTERRISYVFRGFPGAPPGAADLVIAPAGPMPRGPRRPVAY